MGHFVLVFLIFLSVFTQTLADSSRHETGDHLPGANPPNLGQLGKLDRDLLFNSQSRKKRQQYMATQSNLLCHHCQPASIGSGNFDGVLGKETFSYKLDENGCPQITVTCSGFGNVFIMVNTSLDPSAVINFTIGEISDYNVVTATMSCDEWGWGGTDPSMEFIDNAVTCQVDSTASPYSSPLEKFLTRGMADLFLFLANAYPFYPVLLLY